MAFYQFMKKKKKPKKTHAQRLEEYKKKMEIIKEDGKRALEFFGSMGLVEDSFMWKYLLGYRINISWKHEREPFLEISIPDLKMSFQYLPGAFCKKDAEKIFLDLYVAIESKDHACQEDHLSND